MESSNINSPEAIEKELYSALETYSNIHRGSGQNSEVTSGLFEQARDRILTYLGLSSSDYQVIFCSPRRAALLTEGLAKGKYRILSSEEFGLPLGVRAVALRKGLIPANQRFFNGGGTARLVAPDWIIWTKGPGRYEAGTPAVINILTFIKALELKGEETGDNHPGILSTGPGNPERYPELAEKNGSELLKDLRKTIIGLDLEVNTLSGRRKYVNLDNAASTRTFLPVWDSFRGSLRMDRDGKLSLTEQTKRQISEFINAPLSGYDIIFSSNTTEALSLMAESLSNEYPGGTFVANTILEHNSNELAWRSFSNLTLLRVKADKNGFLDNKNLELLLERHNGVSAASDKRISLVSVSGASNVLGTFNNLETISDLVHKYGARLCVDAAQLIAHRSIDVNKLTIDYMVFSGHKIYAPFGTGVLVARKGSLCFSQDELKAINSSGEENAAGIAALGKAISYLDKVGMDVIQSEESELTAHAISGMKRIKDLTLYGLTDIDSPLFSHRGGVISFTLNDKLAGKIGKSLARRGIGIRTGCHCAHLLVKYLIDIPPFLEKFQGFLLRLLPKLELPGIARISLGIENNREDIDIFLRELQSVADS